MTVTAPAARFEALDSLRGICALLVAYYHLNGATIGEDWLFIGQSWMFVDFFFVLSGFVIAHSYGERLATGFSTRDFFVLRLGRVYPLHVVVLLAMVLVECAGLGAHLAGMTEREAFVGTRSPSQLFGSLSMVHIFGLWDHLLWNGPSWSIAAEVWTYLIFAIVCRFARAHFASAMLLLAAMCAGWLAVDGGVLDRTYSMSLPRCIFGFGLGVAIARWRSHALLPGGMTATVAGLVEVAMTLGVIAFVCLVGGPWQLSAPLLFALAVLLFAQERGFVSRVLLAKPLRQIGLLSYAIYMVHIFILSRMNDVLGIVQRSIGLDIVTACPLSGKPDCFLLGGINGPLVIGLYTLAVLATAWLAYRFVETPGREWSRRWVKRNAAPAEAEARDHAAF